MASCSGKSGGTVPHFRKWGYAYPSYSPPKIATLVLRGAVRGRQSPQRTVLGQVDCFVQCEVVGCQIALDGVQPRDRPYVDALAISYLLYTSHTVIWQWVGQLEKPPTIEDQPTALPSLLTLTLDLLFI